MPSSLGWRERDRYSVELPGSEVVEWVDSEEQKAHQLGKSFEVAPPKPWNLDPDEKYIVNIWRKSDKPFRYDPYRDIADVSLYVHTKSVREAKLLSAQLALDLERRLERARWLESPPSESIMNRRIGPR